MSNAFNPGQGVPASVVAGDAWAWRVDGLVAVYPSPEFSLAYHLAPRTGGAAVVLPVQPDAEGLRVFVMGDATAALAPGSWVWSLKVSRASDGAQITAATGCFEVKASPAAGADQRSQSRRLLDAINAILEGRVVKDVESYSIEGRSLTRIPFAELRTFRARLMREVAAEGCGPSGPGGLMRHRKMRFRHV